MKVYGSLEIIVKEKKEYWKITGPQPVILIRRIIPSSGLDETGFAIIPNNKANVEYIEWLMMKFPLDIISKEKWNASLNDLYSYKKKIETVRTLEQISPKPNFRGTLFDFQKEGLDFLLKTEGRAILADEMGLGKAQPMNSKILTPYGWSIMGSLKVGDQVMGVDGKPVKIQGIFPQGKQKIFEVCFNDGSKTKCTEEHLWNVKDANQRFRNSHWRTLELKQIRRSLKTKQGNSRHFIPIVKPIEFYEKSVTIDPYLLGVILGDGWIKSTTIRISTIDKDILTNIQNLIPKGVFIRKVKGNNCNYSLTSGKHNGQNNLMVELRKMQLMGKGSDDKFIPTIYLEGSIKQRIAMIQGLLDTDGYVSRFGTIQYSSNSEFLIKDMIELIRSVGGIAKLTSKISASKKRHWIITISLPDEITPFRITRKLKRVKLREKYKPYRCITSIEYVGIEDAQCIKVDSKDGLYITDDYIVTHNTIQTLAYLATDANTMPALIISPVVTLWNWKNEINKFMLLKAEKGLFKGRELEPRISIIRNGKQGFIPDADFYIINYELLHKRVDDLRPKGIQSIIGDEIQNIRNMNTKKYTGMKEMSELRTVKHVIGLSGTPIYNRGSEIWPIVSMVQDGVLGTWKEFVNTYCWIDQRDRAIVHTDMREAIADKLREGVLLRRKKVDVLKDLPEKIKYNELIETDSEYYEKELRRIYEQMMEKKRQAKTELEKFHAYQEMERNERKIAGMSKVPFVVKFIHNMMELEESVVVFCHHIDIHQALHRQLFKYYPAKIIGGQTDKERQANIETFQKGETKLLIAGLRAGNVGINLTNASYVIHAELDWTPAIHQQAEDRLHRIGQKNKVFSYYLIGVGTMDERVAGVLATKKMEIDSIMQDKPVEENQEKAREVVDYIRSRLKEKREIVSDDEEEIPTQQGLLF